MQISTMLRFLCFVGAVSLAATYTVPKYVLNEPNIPAGDKDPQHWYDIADATINRRVNMKQNENIARNVILFVGDGMGPTSVTAGRMLRGHVNNKPGEETVLNWETFPNVALSKTYNVDQMVPDSAATATALLSGAKNNYAQLGVNGKVAKGDCAGSQENQIDTILDWCLDSGRKVGVVTSARITHATPAAAYAHTPDRTWETDIDAPQVDQGCKDIARQLIEDNPDISVLFGGGRRYFMLNTTTDPETGTIDSKQRQDGRDLIKMWEDDKKSRGATYKYAWNKDGFDAIDPATHDFALGLFEPSHMQYEIERDTSKEPSLADLTRKAINMLKRGDDGFFLMVEGARIDHAHHENLPIKALFDVLALEDAVQVAMDITDESDTLIIVTSDHDESFGIQGYAYRGSNLFGEVKAYPLPKEMPKDDKPMSILVYTNGPAYAAPREVLDTEDLHDVNYAYPGGLPLRISTHDPSDVAIYARGPMAHLFYGVQEQSTTAHVMAYAACVGRFKDKCTRSDAFYASTSAQTKAALWTVVPLIMTYFVLE